MITSAMAERSRTEPRENSQETILSQRSTTGLRDAIASCLRTSFTYTLELRTPAWIDRTIGTTIVTTTDQYDNLTRRHTLTRTVDGSVENVLVTEDDTVVKTWLTKWSRVPVAEIVLRRMTQFQAGHLVLMPTRR